MASVLCAALGCNPYTGSPQRRIERSTRFGDERLEYVVNSLQHLEGFDDAAMQSQIVNQLNAWIRGRKPAQGWELDPMVQTLPESIRKEPLVATAADMEFHPYDGVSLYEATTLRDVSDWAAGDSVDRLSQAKHLFDWTIRNIQLEPATKDNSSATADLAEARTPWQTVLFGKGTSVDRAWVFMLLLRQRSLDSTFLAIKDPQAGGKLRLWAVAVPVEDKLYLFDPLIGLPIPGAGGARVDPKTGLSIEPATLSEIAEKPELLRTLDLDEKTLYPISADSLKDVTALLEASPASLSARMDLLESQLVGDDRTILTSIPSALAERLKKNPHIKSVALWEHPFRVIATASNPTEPMRRAEEVAMRPFHLERRIERSINRHAGEQGLSQAQAPFMRQVGGQEEEGERRVTRSSPLWRGRTLYLKGRFLGDNAATPYFQMARPSEKALSGIAAAAAEDGESGAVSGPTLKAAWERAKQDASYWLGIMNFERSKYGPATDYFVERVLGPSEGNLESSSESPWTSGATYNLGRTFEAEGRFAEAIGTYRKNGGRPNQWQSILRARMLESSEKSRQ